MGITTTQMKNTAFPVTQKSPEYPIPQPPPTQGSYYLTSAKIFYRGIHNELGIERARSHPLINSVTLRQVILSHSFLSCKTEMLISTTQDAVGRDQIK